MGIKYIGDSNQLAFQFESGTYGTASGGRQWIGLVQDNTPDENVGVTAIRYQGGYDRSVGLFSDGRLEYGGTFNFYPQDWKFLGFALGSVNNEGPIATGSHLIRETNSDKNYYAISGQSLPSFTLEDSKKTASAGSNFKRTFKGCMVNTMRINIAEGEIVNCEIEYRAQTGSFSSGLVATVTARKTKPYMWSDVSIHLPSGTPLTNATEYNITINNNLQSRFPLNGNRTVEKLIPLNRDYEVAATFLMDSSNASALYNTYYLQGGTFNSMVILKAAAGSAFIIMSGCKITDMEIPSLIEGLTEQTCTIIPTNISVNVYDKIGSYNAW